MPEGNLVKYIQNVSDKTGKKYRRSALNVYPFAFSSDKFSQPATETSCIVWIDANSLFACEVQ